METTVLQVTVQEWPSLVSPTEYKMSFGVRLPRDVYMQEITVSSLEYEALLDRCWEVIKERVMEHYKEKVAP